jgi:hypothetical protein
MKIRRIERFGVLSALLLISAVSSPAQIATASITGVVQDTSGALVPGADVTATQTATGYSVRGSTGGDGRFLLSSLPVGPYTLTVQARGFSLYTQSGIVLTVGQVANVPLTLQIGTSAEKIEVTADAQTVQATESTIQTTVPETIVSQLPLNGRNPAALLYTVAGVNDGALNIGGPTHNPALSTVRNPAANVPASVAPTTHGVISGGTYFSLDGANNVDPYAVLGGPFPNPDATQEFNVATGSYGARYVSAPGGAVNIVTKSGTNQLHGALFEYLRNGFFNAENAILQRPDILKRNQFGGAFGGPIIKDRWFIFGSYQGTRQSDAAPSKTQVPTADERNGIFTTPFGGTVQIPKPQLSPTIQHLLALVPLPNAPGGFYVTGNPSTQSDEQFVIKSDFNMGNHRLFGRYFYDHFTRPSRPLRDNNLFTGAGGSNSDWDSMAFGDTWSKSHWVAESRVSYSEVGIKNIGDPVGGATTMSTLGAQNFTPGVSGGAGIVVYGSAVIGTGGGSSIFPRHTLDVSEDVGGVLGKHQLAFGFNFRKMHFSESNDAGQSGVFIHPGVTSLILFGPLQDQAVADFVLGAPFVAIQGDGFFVSSNGNLWGMYVEDKYHATSRLTVTAGLRWDPYLPLTPDNNHIDCWRPGEQSTVYTNAPTGVVYPGDRGCTDGGTSRKLNNFQPRIGLAYQVDQKGKTAIRTGYGVYSMTMGLQSFLGFAAPPFVRTFQVQQPFLSIDNLWASAHVPNPFAGGFHDGSYVPTKDAAFPASPFYIAAIAPDFKPGYVQQWTLSLQHAFTGSDSVEIAYVGTKGTHIIQTYDDNAPVFRAGASAADEQARRPDQALQQIRELRSNSNSSYNGLELSYNHRVKGGLFANSSFAWSKCIDEGSSPATTGGITEIGNNPSLRRGRCDFDQNYVWRTTATWQMPQLKRSNSLVRATLRNWTLSGLLAVDAGQTFSVTDAADNSHTGFGLDLADRVPGQPVFVNGSLNYKAFQNNAPGTFGNSGRNNYRARGYRNIDMAMIKNIPISERWKAAFRAEAFNLFNHANYFPPVAAFDAGAASFGSFTVARDPRILQFSLRMTF